MLEAIQDGHESFYSLTSYHLPQTYTEFPESMEYTINANKKEPPILPWTSYAIILKSQRKYIGQCGFKSSPDTDGQVELGYEIAEDYRLNGYANEVIVELIDIAFSHAIISSLLAHTLAEQNISNHLLIKHGFVFDKAIIDEEDGKIWKWVLSRNKYHLIKLMHLT
jgi:[ribosomal protein S5]-alanine N-acetyltransferase